MTALESSIVNHFPECISHLEKLVGIGSHSFDRDGVSRVAEEFASVFAPLGFTPSIVPAEDPRFGGHLFLDRPGSGPQTILFIGHLDTVFGEEECARESFFWRPDGGRVFGPGVMDIKGGNMMAWLVVKALSEADPDLFGRVSWGVYLNSCEEVFGDDFARAVLGRVDPARVAAALVMETGPTDGRTFRIIAHRFGKADFRITSSGKGAHGGNSHLGASAIRQLAEFIIAAENLTDRSRGITVGTGTISGGEAINRVPQTAEAAIEVRAPTSAALDETVSRILAMDGFSTVTSAEGGFRAKIGVRLEKRVPPCEPGPASLALARAWQEAGNELGLNVETYVRGGLSDANYLGKTLPVLDALGPGGANPHTSQYRPDEGIEPEWMDVGSFPRKTLLNALALTKILRP